MIYMVPTTASRSYLVLPIIFCPWVSCDLLHRFVSLVAIGANNVDQINAAFFFIMIFKMPIIKQGFEYSLVCRWQDVLTV